MQTEQVIINVNSLRAGKALDAGHFGPVLCGTYCALEQVAEQIPVALKQLSLKSDDENSKQQQMVCSSTVLSLEFLFLYPTKSLLEYPCNSSPQRLSQNLT